ncbi:MAG: hypothetical protein M3P08_03405 [Thermoproteota archaeon]|nr:hypothetical protein [Thermoproteota archaeon]
MTTRSQINLLNLLRCKYKEEEYGNHKYIIIPATPAKGILYLTQNSPGYISGHVRARGRENGSYPYNYLEMIDTVFGKEDNTIEVCAGMLKKHGYTNCFTVDVNSNTNPDLVDDGRLLSSLQNAIFNRWRCDPPYNVKTAKKMYGTELPAPIDLLRAGTRVCKVGALMFLLVGHTSYQPAPQGVKRIGHISISIIPNNEVRDLNIFYKYADELGSTK